MLSPGALAPNFRLTDEAGRPHSLASLTSDATLVLFFYPADFTPACTKQVCAIRDIHAALARAGLTVAGVSAQGSVSHAKFRAKHALPFILLADTTKSVIRSYEVNGPLGLGVRRTTYLISKDGRIQDVVRADFNIDKHREFVARAIGAVSTSQATAT